MDTIASLLAEDANLKSFRAIELLADRQMSGGTK